MSLVPFTNVELKIVVIDSKAWTRAKEVCQTLQYEKVHRHVIRKHVSTKNIRHKHQLQVVPAADTSINWPKDSQKYDLYINEEGMYELMFSSQQPLAKDFRKVLLQRYVPTYSSKDGRKSEK